MKNIAAQMFYTQQIANQKSDSKTFYRFIATFEQHLAPDEVLLNNHIKMKLINQPHTANLSAIKPKQKVLVFAQVVQQNKLIEGQIRKVTLQQVLKFENLMKKLKQKTFQKLNIFGSKNKSVQYEQEMNSKPKIFGQKNSGFYEHF